MSAASQTLSIDMRAQLIADAGAGLSPTSEVRRAVKEEALKHLREVAGNTNTRSPWPQGGDD